MPTRRTVFDNTSIDMEQWTGNKLRVELEYLYRRIFTSDAVIFPSEIRKYITIHLELVERGVSIIRVLETLDYPNTMNLMELKRDLDMQSEERARRVMQRWIDDWRNDISQR